MAKSREKMAKAKEEKALAALRIAFAAQEEELRAELGSLKVSKIRRRAHAAGIGDDQLEDADDAEEVKAAMIELCVLGELTNSPKFAKLQQGSGPAHSEDDADTDVATEAQHLATDEQKGDA
jgi:hypothetical protein